MASPAVTVLIARDSDGRIIGSLTLAMFPTPTGLRAWIEDVVVDESARGQGVGGGLDAGGSPAGARGGRADSRPDHAAVTAGGGRLYEREGFQQRDTRAANRYVFDESDRLS